MATNQQLSGQELLLKYAMEGQKDYMHQHLLHNSVDVNFSDKFGKTPLHWLAGQGNLECIQTLLPHVNAVATDADGATALHEAVLRNHPAVVEYLLEDERFLGSMNAVDNKGRTALHWAVNGDRVAIMEILLRGNADFQKPCEGDTTALGLAIDRQLGPTLWMLLRHFAGKGDAKVAAGLLEEGGITAGMTDSDGRTMLSYAAQEGNMAMAEMLLKIPGNGFGRRSHAKAWTPLFFAVQEDHENMVKLLIDHEANVDGEATTVRVAEWPYSPIYQDDRKVARPLVWAAENNRVNMVRLLLDNGAKAHLDHEKDSPISRAAMMGNEAVVKLLLSRDGNIEHKNEHNMMPLLLAVHQGHEDTARILLEWGANTEARGGTEYYTYRERRDFLIPAIPATDPRNGWTPLLYACSAGLATIVQVLLEHGAEVEAQTCDGGTPLLQAAAQSVPDVVDLLLRKGASVEVKDSAGMTPLMMAARYGRKKNAVHLIAGGADINAQNVAQDSSLVLAIEHGDEAMVDVLTEACGMNLELRGPEGKTALSTAAVLGNANVVIKLLDRGASIEARDDFGRTPLWLAARYDKADAAEVLLQRGADVKASHNDGATPLRVVADQKGDVSRVFKKFGVDRSGDDDEADGVEDDVL